MTYALIVATNSACFMTSAADVIAKRGVVAAIAQLGHRFENLAFSLGGHRRAVT